MSSSANGAPGSRTASSDSDHGTNTDRDQHLIARRGAIVSVLLERRKRRAGRAIKQRPGLVPGRRKAPRAAATAVAAARHSLALVNPRPRASRSRADSPGDVTPIFVAFYPAQYGTLRCLIGSKRACCNTASRNCTVIPHPYLARNFSGRMRRRMNFDRRELACAG